MTSILLFLNSSKTEFLLIGLKRQLSKIHNSSTSIDTTQSARNLGFIFDKHLSFSDQISALSKSCYHHIRALRCIRPYLDLHTTKTVATSIVHFTPILKSLHWLIVSERIEYKIISLTYKILNTTQPSYLYDLVSIRPPHGHNTRSSSLCHSHQTIIIIQSHSSILHLVFGTSFLHHSEFLIQITYPPLSDLHLNMPV